MNKENERNDSLVVEAVDVAGIDMLEEDIAPLAISGGGGSCCGCGCSC
jgi:hypothetical protein